MNPRYVLKLDLLEDHTRRVVRDGRVYICEGQSFRAHDCAGGITMNECIYTRGSFQGLPKRKHKYFWSPINCALMCSLSHSRFGESHDFRAWWRDKRAGDLYGYKAVAEFINGAPTEIKAIFIAEVDSWNPTLEVA